MYAGIGSRQTPPDVQDLMREIALMLCREGWTLRSGGAEGADKAFEEGADGQKEIFLPWRKFNNSTSDLYCPPPIAFEIAAAHHAGWQSLNQSARNLMARNVQQVLGQHCRVADASEIVICWTADKADGTFIPTSRETGGTGQAIRVAATWKIPVCNLAKLLAPTIFEYS